MISIACEFARVMALFICHALTFIRYIRAFEVRMLSTIELLPSHLLRTLLAIVRFSYVVQSFGFDRFR